MEKYIDLHMHTIISDDGEFEPEDLVRMNDEAGIRIMAIADHNSVRAVERAQKEAEKRGMTYIPAIEIDCVYNGINLHVLGYGIDVTNPVFETIEKNVHDQELAASALKLRLTNEQLGFDLTEDQMNTVSANGVYTGEMFGEVLLKDPRYMDNELLKPYREGGARSDNPYVNFYWDFYAQGKPCYTDIKFPSMEETIKNINDAGGIAVLAHPGNNLKGQFEVFDEMVAKGMQGVEAFSSYHAKETNEYFYDRAKKFDVLYTCGSDFHGKTKPAIHLGEMGCFIDEHEIEDKLRAYGLIK